VLDHEMPGLIPTSEWKLRRFKEPWQPGETLSVAIGQGFDLLTPMQAAVMVSAIANGGTVVVPRPVLRIEKSDSSHEIHKTFEYKAIAMQIISDETREIIAEGLRKVVNERGGTAYWYGRLPDVVVAGKTGTAQVIRMEENIKKVKGPTKWEHRDHAWFVAYAPAGPEETPKIAVAVIVEHGGHGSTAAAPIARTIIKAYLDSLGSLSARATKMETEEKQNLARESG